MAPEPVPLEASAWFWVLLVLVVLAAVVVSVIGWGLKSMLSRAIPSEIYFEPARIESHPRLDGQGLNYYTETLTHLGFQWVADYSIRTVGGACFPSFARIMIHPEKHLYAEFGQLFPPDQMVPLRLVIATVFDNGASYSTTDRKPDGGTWMLRRPRSLWHSYPDMPPADLLKHHLAFREKLTAERGWKPETGLSFESYQAHERKENGDRREVFRKKNIFRSLWEMQSFGSRPRYEWLGE